MDNNLSLGANIDAKKYPQKNGVIEGKVLDQKNRVLYLDLGIYGIGVVRGYEFLQARESIKDLKIKIEKYYRHGSGRKENISLNDVMWRLGIEGIKSYNQNKIRLILTYDADNLQYNSEVDKTIKIKNF